MYIIGINGGEICILLELTEARYVYCIIGICISIKYVGNKFHKNNVIGLILKKERVRTLSDSVAEPEPEEPKLFWDLEPEPEPKINFNKHFLQSFVGC